jgi:hypothetical protein
MDASGEKKKGRGWGWGAGHGVEGALSLEGKQGGKLAGGPFGSLLRNRPQESLHSGGVLLLFFYFFMHPIRVDVQVAVSGVRALQDRRIHFRAAKKRNDTRAGKR